MIPGLRLVVLGIWIGALASFGVLFVPAAFSSLPTPGHAASVVGAALPRLDQAGLALGLLAAGLGPGLVRAGRRGRVRGLAPMAGAACHALSLFWISPAIRSIREAAGGTIASLAPDDPRIDLFSLLHQISLGAFGLAVLIAIGACVWDLRILSRDCGHEPPNL